MKKKITILLFLYLFLISLSLIIICINKKEPRSMSIDSNLAIMVFDESTNDYVKNDSIPTGDYLLNSTKTTCINGGEVSGYNSENGTVKYSFLGTDSCYLFFDKILEKKGPTYVSGGTVSNGSIADSVWSDDSEPITLYYAMTMEDTQPEANAITSTSQTIDMSACGNHYVWAKAVDRFGNYTIRKMGNYDSAGEWSNSGTCSDQGWQAQTRTNLCTNEAENQNIACNSQTFTEESCYDLCSSRGFCSSKYYYSGGVKKRLYDMSTACMSANCPQYYTCNNKGWYNNVYCYYGGSLRVNPDAEKIACYYDAPANSWHLNITYAPGYCDPTGMQQIGYCLRYYGGNCISTASRSEPCNLVGYNGVCWCSYSDGSNTSTSCGYSSSCYSACPSRESASLSSASGSCTPNYTPRYTTPSN